MSRLLSYSNLNLLFPKDGVSSRDLISLDFKVWVCFLCTSFLFQILIFYSSLKHIPCCCHLRSTPSICSLELLVLEFVLWCHFLWFFDDVSSWIIASISSTTSVVLDSKSSTELDHFFSNCHASHPNAITHFYDHIQLCGY